MTREHVPTDRRNQAGDSELRRRVFVVILRLFRVLKLARYVSAADALIEAMVHSWRKIVVFL